MKRIILLLLPAALLVTAFTVSPEKLNITIKDAKLMMEKKQVNADWTVPVVRDLLGTPNRTTDASDNRAYTYDNFGMTVNESVVDSKATGKIKSIVVNFLQPKPSDVNAKGTFKGTIKIDDLELNKDVAPDKIRSALSAWTESGTTGSKTAIHMEKDGIILDFELTGAGHNLRAVTLSH